MVFIFLCKVILLSTKKILLNNFLKLFLTTDLE